MSRANECAFPIPAVLLPNGNWDYCTPGLTVREEFAKAAMQGLLAAIDDYAPNRFLALGGIAADAVACADAVLAELSKTVTP